MEDEEYPPQDQFVEDEETTDLVNFTDGNYEYWDY